MADIKQVIDNLKQLGLEEKQTQIYLHLLKSTSQTALEISRATEISRTSVYRNLERLQKLGLVEEVLDQNTTKFKASSPEKLYLILRQKELEVSDIKESIPNVISQLSALKVESISPTEVLYFKGKEGVRQLLWNTTKCKSKKMDQFGFMTWSEILGFKVAEEFRLEHQKKKIFGREISNWYEDGTKWTNLLDGIKKYYKEAYIPKSILEINHDTYIYDDIVAFLHMYKGEFFGIEIHNAQIAKSQRQLFEIVWNMAEEMKPFGPFKSKKWPETTP